MKKQDNVIGKTKIYLIENIDGNLFSIYIGKTKNVKQRHREHIRKYGDEIIFTIIDEVNSLERDKWKPLERFYISYFKSLGFKLLNLNGGGGGSNGGFKRPKEFSDNLSKKLKGRKITWSDKFPGRSKLPIQQLNLNGNLIKEWDSSKEACDVLGIDYGTLTACLKGRQKTCNKYKWKYIIHQLI